MPKYIGINNIAREIKSQYIGIGNVAREVRNEYVGINNIARPVFEARSYACNWSGDFFVSHTNNDSSLSWSIQDYLAASSDFMVRKDDIVDVNWKITITKNGNDTTDQFVDDFYLYIGDEAFTATDIRSTCTGSFTCDTYLGKLDIYISISGPDGRLTCSAAITSVAVNGNKIY